MFNYNSNAPSVSANPSFVVPPNDGTGILTIKAITHGYGRETSPVMTYTYYYPDYVPPVVEPSAFLTGPDEINIDETNEIEYTVNIANITDINVFTLKLSYDADKLTFDDIDLLLPSNLSAWVLAKKDDPVAGEIDYTIVSGARGQTMTSADAAELAKLKFTLEDGLIEDDVIETELLSVTLKDPKTNVSYNAEITDAKVSTTVTVDEGDWWLKYDINEDGVFDLLDLSIIIYRYFMVDNTESLWADASKYDQLGIGVINTANIIALYSIILDVNP